MASGTSNDFAQLVKEVEAEARAAGPEAIAELEGFRRRYGRASQLIALRKSVGLTQNALARRSGIEQSEISRLERGEGNPTEATISRLVSSMNAEVKFVPKDYDPGEQLMELAKYMDERGAASARALAEHWRAMPREEFEECARNL